MLVEFVFVAFLAERLVVLHARALKNAAGVAQQLLFPLRDLRRVQLVTLGDLGEWLLLTQGLEGDFAFELGGEFTGFFNRLL